MKENEVLTMRGINKTFPGVKALNGVDFTLRKGEIHALMGENGAGKSTLIKVLTGVYDFEAGEIRVDGTDGPVVNHSTQEAQEKGIATVYQEVNLCPNLSVAENLYIGREPLTKLGTVNRKAMNRQAAALMKQLELDVDVTRNLEEYSLALQQMIAIARAVDMDCKVLILDEPTSSLDDREVEKLFTMMRRLKEKGVGIIFVTHFLEQVYAVCDGITVLRNGQLVGEYEIADLPRVKLVAAMMGKDFDDLASIKPETTGDKRKEPMVIEARGLSHAGTIKPFDLDIHKGEVIGLTGLLGSPVSHSKSPLMHNEAYRLLGLDYVYLCFDVPENNLQVAFEGLKKLNVAGFNCTMPDKTLMSKLVDELSPAAKIIGAVNTVVNDNGKFVGHNTDGTG